MYIVSIQLASAPSTMCILCVCVQEHLYNSNNMMICMCVYTSWYISSIRLCVCVNEHFFPWHFGVRRATHTHTNTQIHKYTNTHTHTHTDTALVRYGPTNSDSRRCRRRWGWEISRSCMRSAASARISCCQWQQRMALLLLSTNARARGWLDI